MTSQPDVRDIKRRMHGALEALRHEFAGLRTGRASASVPEPRMLTVQVWDKANVTAVEKAIRVSDLGLNPMVDGTLVRIPIPELNEERRRELSKVAAKYAEQARVAVRNVRRHGMDDLKRLEKDHEISQDEHKAWSDEIQELTDKYVTEIDQALETKDREIMQV